MAIEKQPYVGKEALTSLIDKIAGLKNEIQSGQTAAIDEAKSALQDAIDAVDVLVDANTEADTARDTRINGLETSIEEIRGSIPEPYTLPTASTDTLGGIKIGQGLSVDENGVVKTAGQVDPNSDGTGEIFNNYAKNKATGTYSHAEGTGTTASGRYGSHAEGNWTEASGTYGSHAEGNWTEASGYYSHAEGSYTNAGGQCSHAEGYHTTAQNEAEHAQGTYNVSNTGDTDDAKTIHSIGIGASGSDRKNAVEVMTNGDVYVTGIGGYDGTNYEGAQTLQESIGSSVGQIDTNSAGGTGEIFNDYENNKATGEYSHAEGNNTTASGNYSHAEGFETTAIGYYSHAEGNNTTASGNYSHAEGFETTASGNYSHAEGSGTTASGNYSHAEGYHTTASGNYSHAEGYHTTALNEAEHAQGRYNVSSTSNADDSDRTIYSIGIGTADAGKNAVAVMTNGDVYITGIGGYDGRNYLSAQTLQKSIGSVGGSSVGKVDPDSGDTGEIFNSYDNGVYANRATGAYSHAEGFRATASGYGSHAEGAGTTAAAYVQHAQGCCNTTIEDESVDAYSATNRAFIIGNGTSDTARGDAFYVLFNGETHADGAYSDGGADYAEMFEWLDGNAGNEDRVGRFVTLDGDKIRTATADDTYILGIVSGAPGVIGNNPMRWHGKYMNDEWGRPVYETIEQEMEVPMEPTDEGYNPESPERQMKTIKQSAYVRKLNPEWDGKTEYALRSSRQEWASIGLMGQLLVRQDGTLEQGKFCKVNANGIATASDSGYYVMRVNSQEQALIMFR